MEPLGTKKAGQQGGIFFKYVWRFSLSHKPKFGGVVKGIHVLFVYMPL